MKRQVEGIEIEVDDQSGDGWMTLRDDAPWESIKAADLILRELGYEDTGREPVRVVAFPDGAVGYKVHLSRRVPHGVT